MTESYYDSDDAYRFYNILNGEDYTGMGRYPSSAEAVNEQGEKYLIGDGMTVCEATKFRDGYVLEQVLKNLPEGLKNKKLRILELGSGRGGMSRSVSLALKEKGLLEQFIATNISEVENNYNRECGKNVGLVEPEFLVRHISFDDLFSEGTISQDDKFDLICSCESLLHSSDRVTLLGNVKSLLNKDGLIFISDILVNAESSPEDIASAKARFSDSTLGSGKEYEETFEKLQMEKIFVKYETEHLQRHYGLIRYTATGSKKEELLGPNGISQEFFEKTIKGLDMWIK